MEAASATRCLEKAEHVLTRVSRFGRRERIHLFSAISAIEPRRFGAGSIRAAAKLAGTHSDRRSGCLD